MMQLTDKQFYVLVGGTILALIVFFAYLDTTGLAMVNTIGGYTSETYGKMHESYMSLFWTFAYGMIAAVAAMFYYFRRDITESLAIFIGTIFMLWGGLEDILYYSMIHLPLDKSMPWLFDGPVGIMSKVVGETTVTPTTLFLQLGLMTLITICTVKWLRKENTRIFGVKV